MSLVNPADSEDGATSLSTRGGGSASPNNEIEIILYGAANFLLSKLIGTLTSIPLKNVLILRQVWYDPSDEYLMYINSTNTISEDIPPLFEDLSRSSEHDFDHNRVASYAEEYYLEGFSDDTESTVQIARRSLDLQNSRINKISLLETLPKPITDTEGYLVLLDSGVRVLDARQIPMRNKSTTAVMKELAVSPYEGWLSIWKGFLPEFIIRVTKDVIISRSTSLVFKTINGEVDANILEKTSTRQILVAKILGQIIGNMCLNFMTIVQVRLVVQTNDKTEKKYKNTLDCVKKTFSEEGGPIALVFGPSFTTSLLYYSLTSVSNVLTNFFILSYLGFTPRKTPWTFTACKILFKTLELGLTLPLEIIANRIYTGLHDSLKRICFEEGLSSTTGIKNKIKQKKHIEPESLIGLKGLYRGFTFRWMSALFSLTYSVLVNKCI